ncbi:DEXH-BOX ATP-DEPENDENT RNA HELICASE DEXH5 MITOCHONDRIAL [Salix purpurea]|uniref:DEXH-BOX ATP-DEPENDENT RNA HELICASE DEXH5 MITOCHONDRIAL n=1 Tax=Salix purpurea TaxID=77065 RepID=A0A9Q1A696_SALPP|nr:DEXH-BOX ATP-DEPENDENT RNA HELICASE DEXH5 MITOCHONDRIAL [Salix purpurea]
MSLRPSSTKTAKSLHSHFKTKTTLKPSLFFLSSLVSIRNHQTLSLTNQPLPRPLRFRHHGILSVKCFGVADSHSSKLALPYARSMQSFNYGRFAYRDVSSDESDYELGSSQKEMTGSTLDNADDWKWKLTKLLQSKDQQEVVSRERKDRRDFEHLSAMATRMGLHSRQYSRIVVFSKVPLPNYRPDLDDKRPQREVILPFGLQREVDAHLKSYVSKNPTSRGFFPPNSLSRSNNGGSMETGERIYPRPELSPREMEAGAVGAAAEGDGGKIAMGEGRRREVAEREGGWRWQREGGGLEAERDGGWRWQREEAGRGREGRRRR